MKKYIISLICLVSIAGFGEELKIGYVDSPPFAYIDNGHNLVVGSDVDIIRAIHRKDTFEFIKYNSSKALIASFKTDGLSYGIGGVSITPERNENVLFSIPTGRNEIKYAYSASKKDTNAIMNAMLHVIRKAFTLLFIALTIIAHTIWAVERFNGSDEHFSKNYFKGIGQAYYWAVVTSSTVGYGDIVPKSKVGRLLTCIIIFGGIIWFGTFITFLNNEVTHLNGHNEFSIAKDFKAIGVPKGSTSEEILERDGIIHIKFDTLKDCLDNLNKNKIECVVYDEKPLKHLTENMSGISIGNETLKVEYLGIICELNNLKKQVDKHILNTLR